MATKATLPAEIKNHKDKWFWKQAWLRMHTARQQFNGAICGSPGTGKSYFALSSAELIDRASEGGSRFDISRVAFDSSQFFDLANTPLPVGSAIVLDDSALSAFSADTLKTEVKQLTKCFISMRHQRRAIFLTFPALTMLTSNIIRCLMWYVEMQKIDYEAQQSFAKVLRLQLAPRTGKVYYHSAGFDVNTFRPELGMTLPQHFLRPPLTACLPSPKLVKDYEAARAAAMKWHYQDSKDLVSGKAESKRTFAEDFAFVEKERKRFEDVNGKVSQVKLLVGGFTENRAKLISHELNKKKRVG